MYIATTLSRNMVVVAQFLIFYLVLDIAQIEIELHLDRFERWAVLLQKHLDTAMCQHGDIFFVHLSATERKCIVGVFLYNL